MKNVFLIVSLFAFYAAGAQNAAWCGTPPVNAALYQHMLSEQERTSGVLTQPSRAGIRWVPVWYHIITKTDGTGGTGLKNVFISHCDLNNAYNPFDIGFFIAGIDTVKNTDLWNYVTMDNYDAFPLYNMPNVCNVYVNGNLPGLCGVATLPYWSPSGGGIFLNDDCIGPNTTTYPHEMGHYFNLLHTFDQTFGVEFVDGSNCANAGDGFCDTPADFLDQRTPCPYTGNETDAHGDLYKNVIDETLYMSYFNDNCVYRFSTEEQAEMNATLSGSRRNYLLNQPHPDLSALDTTPFISPLSGDSTSIAANVVFKWHAIPGAQYYIFTLQSVSSLQIISDSLITDTSIVLGNLAANKYYRYKVRGISYGNTCSPATSYHVIKTSLIKAVNNVTKPGCFNGSDGAVIVTPSNGTAPYTFNWSNGATTASVSGLAPGVYTVTITDASNNIAVETVTVGNPDPLSVSLNNVSNNVNAFGAGGTPPYTYLWNNSATGPYNNNVTFGEYTVTVTDAKGCSVAETINYSPTGIKPEARVGTKVYPNPASQAAAINVEVEINQTMDAAVLMLDMAGRELQQVQKQVQAGTNLIRFATAGLAPGVYIIQVKTAQGMQSQRISVMQ